MVSYRGITAAAQVLEDWEGPSRANRRIASEIVEAYLGQGQRKQLLEWLGAWHITGMQRDGEWKQGTDPKDRILGPHMSISISCEWRESGPVPSGDPEATH